MQECERVSGEVFKILGKTSASPQPCEGALDNPALGKNRKAVQFVALDDLDAPVRADAGNGVCHD